MLQERYKSLIQQFSLILHKECSFALEKSVRHLEGNIEDTECFAYEVF